MEELTKLVVASGGGVCAILLAFVLWIVLNRIPPAIDRVGADIRRLWDEVKGVWRAIDRRNRVEALRLISSRLTAPEIKNEAAILLKELDAEETDSRVRSQNENPDC